MERIFSTIILLLVIRSLSAQIATHDYPIRMVPIKNVVLNDNFWLPKIKVIQDSTIQYALGKCESEGRMESFLVAGGKLSGKVRGKMPFDDTDLYKIIEGASYSLISQPNTRLDATLDSVIAIIRIGQEPDGYLTTWFTIDRMHPPATWVKPSKNRWEAEQMSHELYNSGHMFEAAAAHFRATGKRNFLDIALKNADLLVDNFGPRKLRIPPGHQIVETGLIQLYQITQNKKYLELAKFYLDQRGDSTSRKLFGSYSQDHVPVVKQDEAVGHAVRAVYLYAGMTDIAAIYQDQAYLDAVNKIWENMVNKKMYLTGGIGALHKGEAFGENYELPNLTAYNETCASIGDVSWNQRLFQLSGDAKYFDIIERSLYNGLISGISTNGKKFFYPNPMESDGKYLFNKGASTRQSWFDCSCCPTNLIRFIPSIPGLIYATNEEGLYINLFTTNHAKMEIMGSKTEVEQQTDYPWNGNIAITLNPAKKQKFTVWIRIPGWAQEQVLPGDLYSYQGKYGGKIGLIVNGKAEKPILRKGYAAITKVWETNDKIELSLPMPVRRVVTNAKVATNQNLVAVECGPIVFCAEEADNQNNWQDWILPVNARLSINRHTLLTDQVNSIHVNTPGMAGALHLIPYYLWSNRGVGKMKVWFPVSATTIKSDLQ
jgi:DUF1680 family protein